MYKRDYKKESRYDSQPHVKKKLANRNAARRKMMEAGLVRVGDGKDVHHVGGNALNKHSALRVVSARSNRSYPRTRNARKLNRKS